MGGVQADSLAFYYLEVVSSRYISSGNGNYSHLIINGGINNRSGSQTLKH